MINKKQTIYLSLISGSILVIIYVFFLFYGIINVKKNIKTVKKDISGLELKIKNEIRNKKNINEADKDFLENAYFDKEKDIFENYIRSIFKKYNTSIKVYQSKLDSKDYAELNLTFYINVVDYFRLIKDIENGKRLVIIQNINVNRTKNLKLDVRMTLGAYYN